MQALDVCSLLKESSDAFPISGSILIHKLFKFLIFLLGPPPFLDVLIFLGILRIHVFHFGDDVIDQIFAFTGIIRPFLAGLFATFLLEMFQCTF